MASKLSGHIRHVGLYILTLLFSLTLYASQAGPAGQDGTSSTPPVIAVMSADHPGITLPPVDVTIREVLEILSDYDIVHENKLMTFLQYYGLTDPNAKTIYINSSIAGEFRTLTVIHEILHVIYSRRGYNTSGPFEPLIDSKARALYHQLYEVK